mmetsp:Transcript_12423/g.29601  ORF Transcript_12423/g.29601 Transcript_12423/m.29601 type:complete len:114 (-) Transcript_12423:186-527(-)
MQTGASPVFASLARAAGSPGEMQAVRRGPRRPPLYVNGRARGGVLSRMLIFVKAGLCFVVLLDMSQAQSSQVLPGLAVEAGGPGEIQAPLGGPSPGPPLYHNGRVLGGVLLGS